MSVNSLNSLNSVNSVNFVQYQLERKMLDNLCEQSEQKLKELKQNPQFLKHSVSRIMKNDRHNHTSIQGLMRHYINIYDSFILREKPKGTHVIPLNTGNPGFAPFPPIVHALQKSLLMENRVSYTQYEMQVPSPAFVKMVTAFCQEEQIIPLSEKLNADQVVIGNGTTHLYYLALKSIIKNKGDIILVTRPTYGLFLNPIFTAGGNVGFVDIGEDNSWKVLPKNLEETIDYYNQVSFHRYILVTFRKEYVRFLDCLNDYKIFRLNQTLSPHQSHFDVDINHFDSYVRHFDAYIKKLNHFIDKLAIPAWEKKRLQFSFSPRVRGFYHMNPHNPTGCVYSKQNIEALLKAFQKYEDIIIIQDLAHWGISYSETQAFPFSALEELEAKDKILTLFSLSKSYCVAGLRAGFAIGPSNLIRDMQYRLLNSSSNAPVPVRLAFEALFSTPKSARDEYLRSNNLEYTKRRNLMAGLINGINPSTASDSGIKPTNSSNIDLIHIALIVLRNEYLPKKPFNTSQLKKIFSGIPLVRTLTLPEGCFFHLLDVSKLIGTQIGNKTLLTATDVRNSIYELYSVDTLPGELSANFFNPTLRLSFSLSEDQIYLACKSIHRFVDEYAKKETNKRTTKESKSDNEFLSLDLLINNAIVYFYLNNALQSINLKVETIVKLNYLQHKERLNVFAKRASDLKMILSKIAMDVTKRDQNLHQEIHDYLHCNQHWLQHTILDFEQLKTVNMDSLNKCRKSPASNGVHLRSAL